MLHVTFLKRNARSHPASFLIPPPSPAPEAGIYLSPEVSRGSV